MNKQNVWENNGIKIKCSQYLIHNNKNQITDKLFNV